MSSYDDPQWYEQEPEQQHSNSRLDEQATSNQSSYDNSYAPLPTSRADNDASSEQRRSTQNPPLETKQRIQRAVRHIALLATLIIIAFLGGWFSHQAFANSFDPSTPSRSYANLLQQAWTIVDQNYVDRKAIDYKQMSYQAISAMLAVLHDKGHTRFLTPDDVKNENQSLSGTFTGIGIYLSQDKTTKQIIITSTIPGSPAEKAGFKHGDSIVAVNGVSTVGKDIADISSLIHGKAGTSVSITVQRPPTNQRLTIRVTRAEIKVQNVIMHYIAKDHIADIQIVQFADGVSSQLKDAILQAKKQGATRIILDLRDDPGGYLNEAINTASEFIKTGNVLLEQDSSGQRTPFAVTGNTVDTTAPIVVLVNANTASAAEIVSGALKDNHRAVIMGEKTFGTGTVLQEFPLSDGSAVLLGTQEWLTPAGNFIRDKGITPNISVPLGANTTILTPPTENAANMTEQQILSSGDTQLVAAIHYLEMH